MGKYELTFYRLGVFIISFLLFATILGGLIGKENFHLPHAVAFFMGGYIYSRIAEHIK